LGLVLGWFVAVCAGVGVNTVAPALGLDPRWAPVLAGIRGPNPRLQAALLYAPGVALTVAGLAALAGTAGAAALVEGRPEAWEMLVPLVVGAGVVAAARRRAQEVVRYPVVLGEIEAAWAAREQGEEARHVYLDWVVRLVPAGWRRDLTRELRHLWRTQRGWSLAAWAFAALAALESWSGGAQVGVAGVAIVALGAVRAGAEDPPWLDAWLDLGPWRRAAARAGSVALHASPVVLGTGVGFLHGHPAPLVAAAAALVLVALLSAGVSVALRARAVPVYLPFAVLVWGVLS